MSPHSLALAVFLTAGTAAAGIGLVSLRLASANLRGLMVDPADFDSHEWLERSERDMPVALQGTIHCAGLMTMAVIAAITYSS